MVGGLVWLVFNIEGLEYVQMLIGKTWFQEKD